MFEQIYQWPRLIERHRQAPLRAEREQYLRHLIQEGYSRSWLVGAATFMLHIIRVLELNELRVVYPEEIERGANIWANYRGPFRDGKHNHYASPTCFMKHARNWLRFLGVLGLPPEPPFHEQIEVYAHALRIHLGLAAATIRGYLKRIELFLKWLATRGGSLQAVSISDIDEFLAAKRAKGSKPRSIKSECNALKSFFRFAETQGWCAPDLWISVRAPRVSKYSERPVGPTWKQVRQLLKLTDGEEAEHLRAKAILLLLTVYGLRSGEVIDLRLEDLDWHSEVITVRRVKGGGIQQFPIQYEVGEAILKYIRFARPRVNDRHLFLGERRPWGPLRNDTVWRTVSRRMRELGIELDHVGAHSLRHACATRLLNKGVSLHAIADFLGHRDMHSVSIYAKQDTRTFHKVAAFRLAGLL